jgi:hypothetical protein
VKRDKKWEKEEDEGRRKGKVERKIKKKEKL